MERFFWNGKLSVCLAYCVTCMLIKNMYINEILCLNKVRVTKFWGLTGKICTSDLSFLRIEEERRISQICLDCDNFGFTNFII